MDIVYLGRRKTMELKVGILRVQGAQQIFVPFNSKIRMKAALHQDTGSAQSNRFFDLRANLIYRSHVSIGRARTPVERAKCANNIADVGVVDIRSEEHTSE